MKMPHLLLMVMLACGFCLARPSAQEALLAANDMATTQSAVSQQLLRQDLEAFAQTVEQTMANADSFIQSASSKRSTRKASADWKALVVDRHGQILQGEPPLGALLDAWALNEQILEYLIAGDGRGAFGAQQRIVLTAAIALRDDAKDIAREYLTEEDFEKARTNIQIYVAQNPLKKRSFFSKLFDIRGNLFSVVDIGRSTIGTVASVPLLPGRAAQGIQRGTAEFAQFNETAQRFTRIVENMPEQVRAEMEQLLTRLEDSYTTLGPMMADVQNTANALESMMASADRVSTNVQTVLSTTRELAPAFSETADSVSGAAQALQGLSESVKGLLEQSRKGQSQPGAAQGGDAPASGSQSVSMDPLEYERAAKAIGDAADQVRIMLAEIRLLTDGDEKKEKPGQKRGRPFDVLEYSETANSIESAAGGVHTLLAEARAMGQSGELTSATLSTEQALASLMDRAALRFVQAAAAIALLLFVLIFSLMLVHHWLKKSRRK